MKPDPSALDPQFTALCMTGPKAMDTRTGTAIPRLNLKYAVIPQLPLVRQREIIATLVYARELSERATSIADSADNWLQNATALVSLGIAT